MKYARPNKKESRRAELARLSGKEGFYTGKRGDSIDLPVKAVMIGGETVYRFVEKYRLRAYLMGYLQGIQEGGLPAAMLSRLEEQAQFELAELS